jgi:hypothetical protein
LVRSSSRFTLAVGLLAAVVAGLGLGVGACDKQSSCRPGTVFLHVDLGPFTSGVNELDVGVSVDGATVMHTALAVTPGMRTGGIEVQFPEGYPAGRPVTIQVAVTAAGTEIALHTFTVFPADGCDVVDVMFSGFDAVTGAGGAGGGTGGTGGEAGTLGSVAGTGGRGGTGGSVGGVGTGGRGGTGGVAGSAGRGGTGGACRPTGPENCFNNYDDDCDGNVDCADSDCTPVAQCVPLEPVGLLGVMVSASEGCPLGYANQYTLVAGPNAGGCTGCSCRPPAVTCSATVYSFGTPTACGSATTPGVAELTFSSTQPCTVPSWIGSTQGTIYGVQASAFTVSLAGTCVPSGTPTLAPVDWTSTVRFCATSTVGGGCGRQACVPVVAPVRCAMFDGARPCPPDTSTSYWYTGASDGRTCSSCTCGTPTGASCSGLALSVGSDFSCSTVTQTVGPGQRKCYAGAGVNSPGLVFSGAPTTPTCAGSSTVSGTITPTGMKTVCCSFSGG